jgi:hypothetical protein
MDMKEKERREFFQDCECVVKVPWVLINNCNPREVINVNSSYDWRQGKYDDGWIGFESERLRAVECMALPIYSYVGLTHKKDENDYLIWVHEKFETNNCKQSGIINSLGGEISCDFAKIPAYSHKVLNLFEEQLCSEKDSDLPRIKKLKKVYEEKILPLFEEFKLTELLKSVLKKYQFKIWLEHKPLETVLVNECLDVSIALLVYKIVKGTSDIEMNNMLDISKAIINFDKKESFFTSSYKNEELTKIFMLGWLLSPGYTNGSHVMAALYATNQIKRTCYTFPSYNDVLQEFSLGIGRDHQLFHELLYLFKCIDSYGFQIFWQPSKDSHVFGTLWTGDHTDLLGSVFHSLLNGPSEKNYYFDVHFYDEDSYTRKIDFNKNFLKFSGDGASILNAYLKLEDSKFSNVVFDLRGDYHIEETRFLSPDEFKQAKEKMSFVSDSFSLAESPTESFFIYTAKGRSVETSLVKIEEYRQNNREGEWEMFVDLDGTVYFNGNRIEEFKQAPIFYPFLLYFLKRKGKGGNVKNLFIDVWREGKVSQSFKLKPEHKQCVERMVSRLNDLLKRNDLETLVYSFQQYSIPPSIDFVFLERAV